MNLHTLMNTTRPRKQYKRVGRGVGSGLGKTCGRGEKGAGARSGWKKRAGYEGGQMRLFMKLPQRGFSNFRFRRPYDIVNLSDLQKHFEKDETVNILTLAEKGFIKGQTYGVKLLARGELSKILKIEVDALSEGARKKLEALNIEFRVTS